MKRKRGVAFPASPHFVFLLFSLSFGCPTRDTRSFGECRGPRRALGKTHALSTGDEREAWALMTLWQAAAAWTQTGRMETKMSFHWFKPLLYFVGWLVGFYFFHYVKQNKIYK